ncbi:UBP-type zinc finger domain-containing protein [Stackebrandtia soli]|uniref:UBP-type zinc finger domain-containing protein n=1 Tax=Stackebrandtia soli TaxID=1892856 RepID=UPI0039E96811
MNDIDPSVPPSGTGCVECLAGEGAGWWVHLRRCAACGHIGCCDTSPSQHATQHHVDTGHRFVTSFEPDENWYYDYADGTRASGPRLAAPQSHPVDQPTPGPAGRVPPDWRDRIKV